MCSQLTERTKGNYSVASRGDGRERNMVKRSDTNFRLPLVVAPVGAGKEMDGSAKRVGKRISGFRPFPEKPECLPVG